MLRKLYFLLLAVLSLASCKESEKDTALRLVREWDGKEIKFPSRSVFTIQGKDTVDFDFKDAEYKVVTYVDSAGCTSCKLQLDRWKAFIAEVDSLTEGTVPFVLYFHPKDMRDLRYTVRLDNFKHPICCDIDDEFNRLNRFPSEMMFQTFLLDKDNKVQVIGNPVLIPQVKELYLKRLTGKSEQLNVSETKIYVDRTEYDFGKIPQSGSQTHIFRLVNTGDVPLVVKDAVPSCDCTHVEYATSAVQPGDTMKIRIVYSPDELGQFYRSVDMYLNVKKSPITLWIKGEVSK